MKKRIYYRFQFGCLWQLKLTIAAFFRCRTCCLDKKDQVAISALYKVRSELDAGQWIKLMRMTKIALKRMHTKREFRNLAKKCDMKPVTLDRTEDNSDQDES